jgi:hypothetical protein
MSQRGPAVSSPRLERLAPLTGIVFAVIFYVAVALSGDEPDADASAAKAVQYWSNHDTKEIILSVLGVVATLFFIWFAGTLRARLYEAEGGTGRLASTAFAGAVMFSVGLLSLVAISFTAADTAGDVAPTVTQTLNALNSDFFFPAAGGGAVLYLATGVAVLRTLALPRWLGWVSVVLGVICFTPAGFVPFLLLGLWVVVISVILYRAQVPAVGRTPRAAPPAPAAPAV